MALTESTARPLPVYEDWDLATPGNQSLSTKFPALNHPDLRTLSEARLIFNLLADPAQLSTHSVQVSIEQSTRPGSVR